MKRSKNFVIQDIGGKKLLVPIGAQVLNMNGLVILNSTAAYLWELLKEPCTLEELSAALAENFDILPEQALVDVKNFINKNVEIGIVEA
jgi:hypothetical protein